jgi:hypothetical protein
MSGQTTQIDTTAHSPRRVNPVHAVGFALIGAFATVVLITAGDKIVGGDRYSVEKIEPSSTLAVRP